MANQIHKTSPIGFTSLESETQNLQLKVTGKIPEWLLGNFVYAGPAKFSEGKSHVTHWLDGLTMLHAYKIDKDGVTYSNKFLKSTNYETVKKTGSMNYTAFAQDPQSSIITKIIRTFVPATSEKKTIKNAHANITCINNNFVTLAQNSLPVCFDPKTLDTLNILDYSDTFTFTEGYENPNPIFDKQLNQNISFFVQYGDPNTYYIYRITPGKSERNLICSFTSQDLHYIHSISSSEKYIIIALSPFVAKSAHLILKSKPFIQNFSWKPELGSKFIIIDKINGSIEYQFSCSPFFYLNHINAFEKDNNLIVDMVTYSDSSFIDAFYFDNINEPKINFESGKLTRFTLDLKRKMVWNEIISNQSLDFSTINNNYFTKNNSYVYGCENNPFSRPFNYLSKINTKNHQVLIWKEKYCYPSKPIFISNPNSISEDDGVIASVVLDTEKQNSFLLLLDGITFDEISRITLPHHIPFGLQGIFIANN